MSVSASSSLRFSIHGRSLYLNAKNSVAARREDRQEIDSVGYVFTNRPFCIGERLTLRIHGILEESKSVLGFGMTSCNPRLLKVDELPDEFDLLVDRPEYWVIEKAQFVDSNPGDELSLYFTDGTKCDGEILFAKNDQKYVSLMCVDKTVPLWAFFELGNIRELKILDSKTGLFDAGLSANRKNQTLTTPEPFSSRTQSQNSIQQQGTLLTSKLRRSAPPPPPKVKIKHVDQPPAPLGRGRPQLDTKTLSPQLPPITQKSPTPARPPLPTGKPKTNLPARSPLPTEKPKTNPSTDDECTVCMENSIDCVLYTCGHMCLCYDCAVNLRNRKDSNCPICRKEITDIIKTFKA